MSAVGDARKRLSESPDTQAEADHPLFSEDGEACTCGGHAPSAEPDGEADGSMGCGLPVCAKCNDLAAFLAELPADVFSERVIGLIREWADEWRTGGGEG